MWKLRILVGLAGLLGLVQLATPVQAGWSVGVRFNFPGYYYYRPYCGPYYYDYRPYPVYVAPPPVYVPPPVVIQQPPPVVQPAYPAPLALVPTQTVAPALARAAVANATAASDVQRHLQLLADADEKVRADSVMQLGRMRATQAVDPLAATLAGDRSPLVREAAARALGLIGSSKALTALQRAGLADTDRDVRHSAQFAIDVIQTGR